VGCNAAGKNVNMFLLSTGKRQKTGRVKQKSQAQNYGLFE
jgi:hypothetical protein